jgi:hypothetical protein
MGIRQWKMVLGRRLVCKLEGIYWMRLESMACGDISTMRRNQSASTTCYYSN